MGMGPRCQYITQASRCTSSITCVSIRCSAVLAEGSQTAGGPGAVVSKQTGVIRRVEERIKQRIQRVGRAAQRAVGAVGAGAAVACRGAVGRGGGGGPVAGRRQRSHRKLAFRKCTDKHARTRLPFKENTLGLRWEVLPFLSKSEKKSNKTPKLGQHQTSKTLTHCPGIFVVGSYIALVHCG